MAYTDETYKNNADYTQYKGEYMYTAEGASAFEAMLAGIGDTVLRYESKKYKQQRLIAFSNHPMTDPFKYPVSVTINANKSGRLNVENIKCTDKVISGQFASYHVYPYYPDFLKYMEDWSILGIEKSDNSYRAYLTALNKHHSYPVVISEFGIPTSRGMSHSDSTYGRNMGNVPEAEQGDAIVKCYEDIMASGSAGSCIFAWQDEWLRHTWNTMYAVDVSRSAYWSDFQTSGQHFGLLAFDSGKEKSVSYVDGDTAEWTEADIVSKNQNLELSMKYDEKFIYFLVKKSGFDFEKDKIYIPLDITPKSGSNYCENYNIKFENDADFVVVIDGKENSRIQVQKRYEALRSTFSDIVYSQNAYAKGDEPDAKSPEFVNIDMLYDVKYEIVFDTADKLLAHMEIIPQVYETGKLRYGNANPESSNFDSIADFCAKGEYVEIRLPWQLLNFRDPTRMEIHDDYYEGNYGVEGIKIKEIGIGAGMGENGRIPMDYVKMKGWDNKPTFHERLKNSYYVIQELWTK